jgi:ubiquinone/menaquinone biosynthesis C-methylase UbiE
MNKTLAKEATQGALAGSDIHEQWISLYRTPETQGFFEMAFDAVARRLNAPANATILDVGCGSCAKSVLLATRGFRVVATDFSSEALVRAAKTVGAQEHSDRITLLQGDLLNLPFADGEFRYALCWGVLMHVPQLERATAELARVLAPDGVLVLSEANMHSAQAVVIRTITLRKGPGRTVWTNAGIETHVETAKGALVIRQTDMRWLERQFGQHGLTLEARLPGQFTELYAATSWQWLRRAIHKFNHLWFTAVRRPGPAYANILIFRKTGGAANR